LLERNTTIWGKCKGLTEKAAREGISAVMIESSHAGTSFGKKMKRRRKRKKRKIAVSKRHHEKAGGV